MRILKRELQLTRENEIDQTTFALFGSIPPNDEQLRRLKYPLVALRYLTISRLNGPIAYLRDSYDPKEKYGPVPIPKLLWGLIRREDTFLACIGREQDHWEIIYLSELIYKLP